MGAKSDSELHSDAADRAPGYRFEGGEESNRMERLHHDGEAVDFTSLPHILNDEHHQPGSGVQLQDHREPNEATSSRILMVRDGGSQIRQPREALPATNRSVCLSVPGEVGDGEPRGVSVPEAFQDRDVSAAQFDSRGLLRLQRRLHEANSPLDQLKIHTTGDPDSRLPEWEVLPDLREGSHERKGQVDPHERDRAVQSASSVRERAQGCEGGSAPDAARRTDAVQQHAVNQTRTRIQLFSKLPDEVTRENEA